MRQTGVRGERGGGGGGSRSGDGCGMCGSCCGRCRRCTRRPHQRRVWCRTRLDTRNSRTRTHTGRPRPRTRSTRHRHGGRRTPLLRSPLAPLRGRSDLLLLLVHLRYLRSKVDGQRRSRESRTPIFGPIHIWTSTIPSLVTNR